MNIFLELFIFIQPVILLTIFKMSCKQILYILSAFLVIIMLSKKVLMFESTLKIIIIMAVWIIVILFIYFSTCKKYGIKFNEPVFHQEDTFKIFLNAIKNYLFKK